MPQHETNIVIDRRHYKSPSPTTDHALYSLAGIPPGYVLFREAHGNADDQMIPDTEGTLELHDGDHFYSAQSSLNPGGSVTTR